MSSKRIKILPSEEWDGVGLFGGEVREIVFKYSVVDVDLIGSSQEAAHTLEGEVVVGISRTLETLWDLEPKSVNRVLLAYAGQLIIDLREIKGTIIAPTERIGRTSESDGFASPCFRSKRPPIGADHLRPPG